MSQLGRRALAARPHPHPHPHPHPRPHPNPHPHPTPNPPPNPRQAKSAAEKLKDALGEAGGRKGCEQSRNVVRDNALLRGSIDGMIAQAGGGGGSCTCPDGQTYQVGDLWGTRANSTAKGECNALACHGGVAGECHKQQV